MIFGLALLALALKSLAPSGFMPGSSLAAAIVLCPHQGATPAIVHGRGHAPQKAPHDGAEHPCAFAGHGASLFATPMGGRDLKPAALAAAIVKVREYARAPGRGLAAPPPPSHAPPAVRT